jgi:uncharacterized membrane protein
MATTYDHRHLADQRLADAGGGVLPIRKIGLRDLREALIRGWDDFTALPSFALFLLVLYPIVGIMLARFVQGRSILPMLFPMVAGFALIGPFAAVGLYELSRRRELGERPTSRHVLGIMRSSCGISCMALGGILLAVFFVWLMSAQAIYNATFPGYVPETWGMFLRDVLTTREGWTLILVGHGVGLLFAIFVFSISVISFPLVLDRPVTAHAAIATSLRAVAANPLPMIVWGMIVAGALMLGSLPLFMGLIVVVPVIAHASWHLYRRIVPALPVRDEFGSGD